MRGARCEVQGARCKVVWATFVPVVLKDTELLPFFSVPVPAEHVACSLQLFGINATGGGGGGGRGG